MGTIHEAGKLLSGISAGICPYAQAFHDMASSEEIDAIVVTTLCDQMRRMAEWIVRDTNRPVFLLNVPSTWQTDASRNYYADELKRLGCFLSRLGGSKPSHAMLAETMRSFDTARNKLRQVRWSSPGAAFSAALAEFNSKGIPELTLPKNALTPRGIPVAVLGGPILQNDRVLFQWIEEAGGNVALDGTENGERGFPAPYRSERLSSDPFDELVHAYFDVIPDPSRRPNTGLYVWLKREIEERKIKGLIVLYYTWCDLWHAEIQCLRELFCLPSIDINLDSRGCHDTKERTKTRIQSLMDMLI